MEKVHLICTYNDSYQIFGLTAIKKNGVTVNLIWYDLYEKDKPYIHADFYDMYNCCLSFAKHNDFRVDYYDAFGVRFYDIEFINIETYAGIQHYGINERYLKEE